MDIKNTDGKKEQSLFETLPLEVQAQIKYLLEMNDFRSAKKLYDEALKGKAELSD